MKQVNQLLRAGRRLTIGITLLVLLGPADPLKAQSIRDRDCRRKGTELFGDFDVRTPDEQLTRTDWTAPAATVGQSDNFLSEFPTEALPLDLSDITRTRSGVASGFGWSSSAEDLSLIHI